MIGTHPYVSAIKEARPCAIRTIMTIDLSEKISLTGLKFPNSGSYRVLVVSFDRYLCISLQPVPGSGGPAAGAKRAK